MGEEVGGGEEVFKEERLGEVGLGLEGTGGVTGSICSSS